MNSLPKVTLTAFFLSLAAHAAAAEPVAYLEKAPREKNASCERYTGPSTAPARLQEKDTLLAEDMMRCHCHSARALIHFYETDVQRNVNCGAKWAGIGNPVPLGKEWPSLEVPHPNEERPLYRPAEIIPLKRSENAGLTNFYYLALDRDGTSDALSNYPDSGISLPSGSHRFSVAGSAETMHLFTLDGEKAKKLYGSVPRLVALWTPTDITGKSGKAVIEGIGSRFFIVTDEFGPPIARDEKIAERIQAALAKKGVQFDGLYWNAKGGNVSLGSVASDYWALSQAAGVVKGIPGVKSVNQQIIQFPAGDNGVVDWNQLEWR
ncbi:BON domain-containing protein [Caballeronia sp. LZ029]|uniref:BON domain-containing protein n=1 Tax=Caballeronia sp. LZ029 TaxID=3038564 RepID=UPI002857B9DA|nr:BON domain-containing protein [Caballeronia sp. LZ029]MDR5746772.1 BON domain-containing protein [Caballeronia sp. LZ029]